MQLIAQPIVEKAGGEVVKFEADNCFAMFDSALAAVQAAIAINHAFNEINIYTADQFDIRVAIHNHPRQPNNANYKVWDPAYVLSVVKARDARIGACADPGHWATSGITPLDGIKTLKGRIVSVHLKDRTAIGKQTEDVPFGAGISNVKGILDELKAQGFAGNISIEYETKWDNNVPDVAQCIGFFRGYGSCQ